MSDSRSSVADKVRADALRAFDEFVAGEVRPGAG